MPDAKDANVPLLLPDVEYDAIESPALAVKKVTGGKAKLLRFSYDRAACRTLAEGVNRREYTHKPLLGVHRRGLADTLESRVSVCLGGNRETNAISHIWRASRQAPERRASVRLARRSPCLPERPQRFPCGAAVQSSAGSCPRPVRRFPPCR